MNHGRLKEFVWLGIYHWLWRGYYLFVENCLQNYIRLNRKNVRLLDLCCGTGVHAIRYAQMGYMVKGVDISSVSIDKAKELAKKYQVDKYTDFTIDMVGEKLIFPNDGFDVIFMSGSLYYLDFEKIVSEISRVLKKGGVFVCIETNGDNFIMNVVRRIKNLFLRHRDTQTISNLLGSKEIDKILKLLPSAKAKYFDFFALASCFFAWNSWLLKKWLNFAVVADDFLLNKLGLRAFCFKFVIIFNK